MFELGLHRPLNKLTLKLFLLIQLSNVTEWRSLPKIYFAFSYRFISKRRKIFFSKQKKSGQKRKKFFSHANVVAFKVWFLQSNRISFLFLLVSRKNGTKEKRNDSILVSDYRLCRSRSLLFSSKLEQCAQNRLNCSHLLLQGAST